MNHRLCTLLILASITFPARAEEVQLEVARALVVTFPSQTNRSYRVLVASEPSMNWTSVQDNITGTGGKVTVFYESDSDQRLFFKVEGGVTNGGNTGVRSTLLDVARLDLREIDLSGRDLAGENLKLFYLTGAIFDGANLNGADLTGAIADGASFRNVDLRQVQFDHRTKLSGADLRGVNLEGTSLPGELRSEERRVGKECRSRWSLC